jgi:uncharacterized protein YndB with AHSA1/START domain
MPWPPEEVTRVFVSVVEDSQRNALLESVTLVSFEDQDGKTRLTVHASAIGLAAISARMLEGMEAGWTQSLERLTRHVVGLA